MWYIYKEKEIFCLPMTLVSQFPSLRWLLVPVIFFVPSYICNMQLYINAFYDIRKQNLTVHFLFNPKNFVRCFLPDHRSENGGLDKWINHYNHSTTNKLITPSVMSLLSSSFIQALGWGIETELQVQMHYTSMVFLLCGVTLEYFSLKDWVF